MTTPTDTIVSRFTDRARRASVLAMDLAGSKAIIGTPHLLLGLIHEGEGVAALALQRWGPEHSLDIPAMLAATVDAPLADGYRFGDHPVTAEAKKAIELSLREALQLGHNYVGTEHLLLGIIRRECIASAAIVAAGVNLADIRSVVFELLRCEQAPPAPTPTSVRLTDATAQRLDEHAALRLLVGDKVNRSDIIREAVDAYLGGFDQELRERVGQMLRDPEAGQ